MEEIHEIVLNSLGRDYKEHSSFAIFKDFHSNEMPIFIEAKEKVTDILFSWNRINLSTKKLLDILINIIMLNIERHPFVFTEELKNFEYQLLTKYPLQLSIANKENDKNEEIEKKEFDNPLIDLVLGTSVIARYSYMYWFDANNDKTNPWYKLLHTDKLPRWLRAAFKDVVGFFTAVDCSYTVPVNNHEIWVTDLNCCWEHAGDESSQVH